MKSIRLCFIFLFLTSALLWGQDLASSTPLQASPPAAQATNADYSSEPFVIEQLDHVYAMAADGTGVRLFTVAARIHSDASVRQLGVLSVPFAGNSEHVELIYVRVRRPDGSVTQTPLTEAIEMPSPVTTAAPFYSDLKELQVPVRNLRVGDRLEWQAKIVRTRAESPGQFWGAENFVTDAVVLSQSVELHVPKDVYVNVWSQANDPVESSTSTERVYRWQASQLKPTVGKEAEAEKDRTKEQRWTGIQEIEAKEGKLPSVAWTTFRNWDAVGQWYRALQADRVTPVDPEVQAKVVEITAGKTTQDEKVRAIYAYVSTQVRYIGVAFGIGRYQPHRAVEVLENRYGDCKDKHTLLASMLSAVGLHSEPVLVGAGIRFNEAVPSPLSFNHLISRVTVEGQPVWLDSTPEVAPYRLLSQVIRDKDALVVLDSGGAKIERTPDSLPFPAVQKMESVGELDNTGTSNSRLVLTLRGDEELLFRGLFHQASPAQYDELVQQMSRGIGYGGTTSHADISRPEDTGEPFRISYDYKRDKAGDWEHLRMIPQLMPVSLPRHDEKEPPVRAISLGVPRTEISTSAMKLPDGWSAEMPPAVHILSAWATYDQTYRFEKGTVYAERKVQVFQEKVPVAEWKSYKKFADEADLGNEKYIQLYPYDAKPRVPDKSANDPKAAKLIAAARNSIQHREFEAAQSQLDQARSLNPEQIYLWTNYGYLEYQRGNMAAAIPDYQKELSLHPENHGVYSSLASAQNILGREKDARETLKTWASAQPDSVAPVTALIGMLLDQDHPSEAVAAAEQGIARLPEMRKSDQRLQLLTGRAQIAAGMRQKGDATLVALIHATTSAEMMNDAAYELAKAGLELPLAESTAEATLAKLSEESKNWSLEQNLQNALSTSRLIANTWDTAGWILFKENKMAEAEGYIQPAWKLLETSAIGGHLAEIEEAKGRPEEALRIWELALASLPSYQRSGVRKTPDADQKEMMDRIEALRKAGTKEPAGDADETLKAMRTISLGASAGLAGTAEYHLLLSKGEVLDVKTVNDKDLPGAQARIMGVKIPALWPKGSEARLVVNSTLNCRADACELYLKP
jgi:transglutaminase-like putative cysteine protease/tetratricopeptide (TPR) repeat protein